MRDVRSSVAVFALLAALLLVPGRVQAQAVAFFPNVGSVPDGVGLGVTPVVSADRRYVRLSLNANFSAINGFMNFPVAGGVSGGGGGGGLGGGGLGALGGNVAGGRGFGNVGVGPDLNDLGVPYRLEYIEANRKATAQAKAKAANLKAKPGKGKKPLADPVMVPSRKTEAKGNAPGAPRG